VPGKDLVTQTLEDYANVGLDTGIYFSDIKMTDNKHIISTWQSLTRMFKEENENFNKITDGVVAIIVDEAHTITGKELRDMLCGPMAHIPLRWALTGTIPKEPHEYNALLCAIGPKVGEVRAADLQELGILSNCDIDIMQLVDDVSSRRGTKKSNT
jgi:superfamily II DNA or RNA helicase